MWGFNICRKNTHTRGASTNTRSFNPMKNLIRSDGGLINISKLPSSLCFYCSSVWLCLLTEEEKLPMETVVCVLWRLVHLIIQLPLTPPHHIHTHTLFQASRGLTDRNQHSSSMTPKGLNVNSHSDKNIICLWLGKKKKTNERGFTLQTLSTWFWFRCSNLVCGTDWAGVGVNKLRKHDWFKVIDWALGSSSSKPN